MAIDKRGRKLPKGIRQRGNTYEGRITYNRKTYTVHGETVTETQKNMTDLKYKLVHGTFVERSNLSLDEWFSTWLDEYKKNRVKIGTYNSYLNYYASLIRRPLGGMCISSIRGDNVQKLYNDLTEAGYALSTIKIVSVLLNGCLQQATRNGMIERNPVKLAELPRQTERKPRQVLTKEQQALFMEYAKKSYLYNFFAVMLRTGMRNGELRGLKFSDIDRSKNVIHVQRTLKYIDGSGYFEDTPKTMSSRRDIPLTADTLRLITKQRGYWGFGAERPNRYLFCTKQGEPLSRDRVQSEIDKIVKEIQKDGHPFERITPHVFRHTFATRAIEAGMQPQVLKTILGHSSLSMTMDLYSHVMPETRAAEMEKIASVF